MTVGILCKEKGMNVHRKVSLNSHAFRPYNPTVPGVTKVQLYHNPNRVTSKGQIINLVQIVTNSLLSLAKAHD